MSSEIVICNFCNTPFQKETKYVTSAKKYNRPMYCNNKCSGAHSMALGNLQRGHITWGNDFRKGKGNKFLYYLRKARSRNRCNLTVEDIEQQWNLQEGKCAYTNKQLDERKSGKNNPFSTASLDRIDSSLPYQAGNIQFIITALNYAKNDSSDSEFRDFLKEVQIGVASNGSP